MTTEEVHEGTEGDGSNDHIHPDGGGVLHALHGLIVSDGGIEIVDETGVVSFLRPLGGDVPFVCDIWSLIALVEVW